MYASTAYNAYTAVVRRRNGADESGAIITREITAITHARVREIRTTRENSVKDFGLCVKTQEGALVEGEGGRWTHLTSFLEKANHAAHQPAVCGRSACERVVHTGARPSHQPVLQAEIDFSPTFLRAAKAALRQSLDSDGGICPCATILALASVNPVTRILLMTMICGQASSAATARCILVCVICR